MTTRQREPVALGPTRENQLGVEQRGLAPVLESERYGRPHRIFTMWLSPQFTPSAMFIGVLAASLGLGYWQGLPAIVIGNVIGALVVAGLCTWGPRTGMGQLPLSRAAFGKSNVLPGVVNWAATIGWVAFNNVFGATALKLLIHVPYWLGLLIIFAGEAAISVLGHEVIHMFEKWMSWVLGVIFVVITVRVITSGGTTALHATAHGADAVGLFFLMLVIAGSDGYAWAPYAADYSRYFPSSVSRRKIFWYTFAGIAGGLTWMMLLGLSVAQRVVNAGTIGTSAAIRDLMGGGVLGVIAMIAIYLATVAADVVNDYTGSLSLQAAGITIRRPVIALINGAAAFGFSAWFLYAPGALYDKVENLLLFFTYWISAWLGVVVVDWVRRRGRVDPLLQHHRWLQLRRQPPGIPASRRVLRVRPAAPGRPWVHRGVRGRGDPVLGTAAPAGYLGPGSWRGGRRHRVIPGRPLTRKERGIRASRPPRLAVCRPAT